ncbi:MAG TPA: hypothetical protein VNO31_12445, partial [Umezawaea sp.]|nr:hypothetical protein [Umezawaea sp.]
DAVTLADCLNRTPDVDVALAWYDEVRRPRTRAVVRRSARLGSVALWSWPPAVAVRDLAARTIPAAAILRSMAPVLGWTPPGAR